jgi:hypothetical protein
VEITPDHYCEVICYLGKKIALFYGSRFYGILFVFGLAVLQQLIFCSVWSSNKSVSEKKSVCIICPCPCTIPLSCFTVACIVVILQLHVSFPSLSPYHMYSQTFDRCTHFYYKAFMFLWCVLFPNYSDFGKYYNFVHSQMLRRSRVFGLYVIQQVRNISHFSYFVIVQVIIVRSIVIV